jgi:flap endonuclease-1
LKWLEPDEESLVKYLCGDKAFNEERVRNGAKKLAKARTGTTQGRLDSFFTVLPSTNMASKRKVRAVLWLRSTENLLCIFRQKAVSFH